MLLFVPSLTGSPATIVPAMNGLVGYGSSDEEDEAPISASAGKPQQSQSSLTNGAVATVSTDGQNVSSFTPVSVDAMVGPSRPDDASATVQDAYEEDAKQEMPSMSEKDLLRYLTQPSHPMASFPPEAASEADPAITARFKRFLELKAKGVHFNEDLAGKSSFKNPTLFASLLERSHLPSRSQYASSVPSEVFSMNLFPPWAYKEELLKSQQALGAELEVTKKAQSTAGKRNIEFTSPRLSQR